jgi:hypothetical protein
MEINTDLILEDLKDGKSSRTQESLDKLNRILSDYTEAGHRDFSVTTIGRISSENGGPGYQALRATRNKHYRDLINAWAQKNNTTMKKPVSEFSRSREVPTDNQLLERIPDPALRAVFGQIIAERNRYRNQVNILKHQANVIIDKRPVRHAPAGSDMEVLPSLGSLLTESEKQALIYALSDECMAENGWEMTKAGQVKDLELRMEIFPRGFGTGLGKLLGEEK